jgi:hypothetical protein
LDCKWKRWVGKDGKFVVEVGGQTTRPLSSPTAPVYPSPDSSGVTVAHIRTSQCSSELCGDERRSVGWTNARKSVACCSRQRHRWVCERWGRSEPVRRSNISANCVGCGGGVNIRAAPNHDEQPERGNEFAPQQSTATSHVMGGEKNGKPNIKCATPTPHKPPAT